MRTLCDCRRWCARRRGDGVWTGNHRRVEWPGRGYPGPGGSRCDGDRDRPQGAKRVTTDSDGRFAVPFLTPGAYTVRVELQGFKTVERNGIAVALGQTVNLPISLDVGAVSETVEVTASTPVIDMATTTSGASITSATLQQVPVGRTISDTLYLAPGVSSSGSAGSANPSISGGSGLDNQYVIDGVNVTNQGYGALGSYSIIFGSLGNATPFDFVDEVEVKTGGYDAEFGQATGGVVNVITKSGSNLLTRIAVRLRAPVGARRRSGRSIRAPTAACRPSGRRSTMAASRAAVRSSTTSCSSSAPSIRRAT